jgi:hypothetical protein
VEIEGDGKNEDGVYYISAQNLYIDNSIAVP